MRPIKTYSVTVQGFPSAFYSARSPSHARARCWRDYVTAYGTSFRDFLRISTISVVANPPGVGERILVGGEPATRVIGFGQYVYYMLDDSDTVLCSHPADVQPLPPAA